MIPTISEITKPLLQALENSAQRTVLELEDEVGRIAFKLTPKELAEEKPSGNERMFLHRLRWAVTYCKKAGLVKATGRGIIQITPRGLTLLKSADCPEKITESYLNRYKSFKDTRRNQN